MKKEAFQANIFISLLVVAWKQDEASVFCTLNNYTGKSCHVEKSAAAALPG